MRIVIVTFPGSNCNRDMSVAINKVTGRRPLGVWHTDNHIPNCDLIIIPGGFSYGDYLRCGALAAHSSIMKEVRNHASRGGAILGICNGFQVLIESGLLPGILMRNISLKFICREVVLKVVNHINTPFLNQYIKDEKLYLPIAHNEGNYYANNDTINELEENGRVAFKYSKNQNDVSYNPNGSINDIAGVLSENGKILGMMPHPERYISEELGGVDGLTFLKRTIASLS